jgi:hypothetical protein
MQRKAMEFDMSENTATTNGQMLAPEAAGRITTLSPKTLANMRVVGGGPPFYKVGRYVRYDRIELEQWMRSRRYYNTAEASA